MDENKLSSLVGQFLQDLGGAFSAPLVQIGEQLGIYAALNDAGPSTAQEIAQSTGVAERYMRKWLSAQTASKYSFLRCGHREVLDESRTSMFASRSG
jgi:hypothetical protein